MEFLAMLYTVLLVAICLMMALLLFRSGRPTGGLDEADCEELKDWLEEQLAAQAREFNARQDAIAQQNYAAIRSVSETLQTAVQSMSTTLGQGQDSQQRILERRLQSLEQANNQQMEQLRRAMVESMTALQAENTRKLDEIRHTVDEQLQDALQKRVTESFKAVNQQLEQVYKGLGEMQSLAADVGGLKQVLSGVKTRGILGEIQLGAILEEILAPEQYDTNVATIPGSTQRVEYAIRMPGADGGSVWLPIDSKFPGDTYAHLQDAYASGDAQAVGGERLDIGVVELIAMTMTLIDYFFSIHLIRKRIFFELTGIRTKTHRATLVFHIFLLRHEINNGILRFLIKFSRCGTLESRHVARKLAHCRLQS